MIKMATSPAKFSISLPKKIFISIEEASKAPAQIVWQPVPMPWLLKKIISQGIKTPLWSNVMPAMKSATIPIIAQKKSEQAFVDFIYFCIIDGGWSKGNVLS